MEITPSQANQSGCVLLFFKKMLKLLLFLTCLNIINAYDYDYKYECDIDNDSRHNLEGLETLSEEDIVEVTIRTCRGVITDKTFKGFPKLAILDIELSNIKAINTTLPIIELWVEDSHFPNLDEDLQQKVPNLQVLGLVKNKDFQVDPHIFENFKNLTRLVNYKTNFTENCVTKEWFQGLDLQELYLEDNNLTCISKDAFNSLTNLQRLHLSNNQISNFERETFEKLTKLNFLTISVNNFGNIDLNTFANQKNSLTKLQITWNTLKQSKISARDLLKAFPKLKWLLIIVDRKRTINLNAYNFCQTMLQYGAKCTTHYPLS